ncbi:hypothetical protein [Candidatus Sneabacter namystus]|uniref:Uncharacterized protein n=1 Tax=Candidatus Sneabacter namystus TaxID=2601646 RepID=A0A5C0UGY3_9RICK|nr:hypothetical protein [Candidatus Sneabacter namystus]QEK39386.1 hypothetical protein FZC37_00285 [Candidatus Sneabacter namystus]
MPNLIGSSGSVYESLSTQSMLKFWKAREDFQHGEKQIEKMSINDLIQKEKIETTLLDIKGKQAFFSEEKCDQINSVLDSAIECIKKISKETREMGLLLADVQDEVGRSNPQDQQAIVRGSISAFIDAVKSNIDKYDGVVKAVKTLTNIDGKFSIALKMNTQGKTVDFSWNDSMNFDFDPIKIMPHQSFSGYLQEMLHSALNYTDTEDEASHLIDISNLLYYTSNAKEYHLKESKEKLLETFATIRRYTNDTIQQLDQEKKNLIELNRAEALREIEKEAEREQCAEMIANFYALLASEKMKRALDFFRKRLLGA